MANVPFNHAKEHDGHYYYPHKIPPSRFPLPSGTGPKSWTPPTYYVYGYKAKFTGAPGNADVTIAERHFHPDSHVQIDEKFNVAIYSADSSKSYVIVREPGTYISVQSTSGFPVDGDKDFG